MKKPQVRSGLLDNKHKKIGLSVSLSFFIFSIINLIGYFSDPINFIFLQSVLFPLLISLLFLLSIFIVKKYKKFTFIGFILIGFIKVYFSKINDVSGLICLCYGIYNISDNHKLNFFIIQAINIFIVAFTTSFDGIKPFYISNYIIISTLLFYIHFLLYHSEKPKQNIKPLSVHYKLTPLELEYCRILGSGYTQEQIADEFSVSYNTVKNTYSRIRNKTGCLDNVQLAVLMAESGIAKCIK